MIDFLFSQVFSFFFIFVIFEFMILCVKKIVQIVICLRIIHVSLHPQIILTNYKINASVEIPFSTSCNSSIICIIRIPNKTRYQINIYGCLTFDDEDSWFPICAERILRIRTRFEFEFWDDKFWVSIWSWSLSLWAVWRQIVDFPICVERTLRIRN